MKEQLTLFPVGFPVSHSQWLENEKERKTNAIYGARCLEQYKKLNRNSSLLKTSLVSQILTADWYSSRCALTWKLKGTKFSRLLFQLQPKTHRTEEIGAGLSELVEQYGKYEVRNATNTNSNGLQQCNGNDEIEPSERGQYAQRDIESLHLEQPITQHTDLQRQKRRSDTPNEEITIRNEFSKRDARSSPTTDWQNFPTQSPICGGDDGLPTELDGITFSKWRAESIKGYGNAIVPQIAYQLFQIIETL
jgi:hypothetical protein